MEPVPLGELSTLPISDRVSRLAEEYQEYNPVPETLHIERDVFSLPLSPEFSAKPLYISVKAEAQIDGKAETVLLTTPRTPEDTNVVRRLGRSIMIREAIERSRHGDNAPEVLQYFRFPEVLDRHMIVHPEAGERVGSMMERYIGSRPVGSVHLADPDAFTSADLLHMAQLFKHFRQVAQPFTEGEEFYHRFISNPFVNHGEGVPKDKINKWWLDYEVRKSVFSEIFGPDFVRDQGVLLESEKTAKLFDKRVAVIGNVIPAILGKDADGKIVFDTVERTAYAEYQMFDEATLLSTLVGNPENTMQFLRFCLTENPTRRAYEHLRGAMIFDKAGNVPALRQAMQTAKQNGQNEQAGYLETGYANLVTFVSDALYRRNYWDPTQYNLSE